MIRRALKFGCVGILASLIGYGVYRIVGPHLISESIRRLLPAVALWLLFFRVLEKDAWVRLFALLALFHFVPAVVYLIWRIPLFTLETRFFYLLANTTLLLLFALTLPITLRTPSLFRSAMRIALAACITAIIYRAFFAMFEVANPLASGFYRFGITGGISAVSHGALFAAIAPDHIAMERTARARKLPTSCEKCGYDLTGNVSGVCPECGTALSEALRQHLLRPHGDVRASGSTADQV